MMVKKALVLATGVAGLLAVSSIPASAQFADFFCDTFTIGCRPPPPPPPPPPAPVVEEPAPMKKVKHMKKKPVMKKAAPAAAAPADAPAAK